MLQLINQFSFLRTGLDILNVKKDTTYTLNGFVQRNLAKNIHFHSD